MTNKTHTFSEWMRELDRVYNAHPAFGGGEHVWNEHDNNAECYRDNYDRGETPEECVAEQLSYAHAD